MIVLAFIFLNILSRILVTTSVPVFLCLLWIEHISLLQFPGCLIYSLRPHLFIGYSSLLLSFLFAFFFCFLCYLCIPQTLISLKIFNLSSEIYSPLSLGQYLLSENRFVKIQFPLCKLSFCDCADINIFMKVTVLDIIVLSTIIKTISKLVAQFEVFLPVYSMFAFEKSINIFFFNKHFLSLHLCWLTYIHSSRLYFCIVIFNQNREMFAGTFWVIV